MLYELGDDCFEAFHSAQKETHMMMKVEGEVSGSGSQARSTMALIWAGA